MPEAVLSRPNGTTGEAVRPGVARGRTAARLGSSGTTFPPEPTSVKELVKDLSREARRSLHATHRQRSKHTRSRKWTKRSPAEKRAAARKGRAERWQRRHQLREFTTLKSVKNCGIAPIPTKDADGNSTAAVSLRVKEAPDGTISAGLGGLQHCGSVWACPVCSATVATTRARDLAKLLRWALDQGFSASFMTLTMRHFKGQNLKKMWDALAAGWQAAIGGRRWMAEQKEFGVEGWVKAVEATHGENGWHVHLHVLLIWNRADAGEVDADGLTEVQRSSEILAHLMHDRWSAALEKHGFESWADFGGLDVRMASLDPESNGLHMYFTKLAFEVSGGYSKLAKGKGRAPFQILNDALTIGLADDFDLWWEWEKGSKRRRQMAWSQDLRERAGLGKEKRDEDIANEELAADEAINLGRSTWARLAGCPSLVLELIEVAEDGGLDAACTWLQERGMTWYHRRSLAKPPDELVAA